MSQYHANGNPARGGLTAPVAKQRLRRILIKFAVLLALVLVVVAGTSLAVVSPQAAREPRLVAQVVAIALTAAATISLIGAAITARRSISAEQFHASTLRRAISLVHIGRWIALAAIACGIAAAAISRSSTAWAWLGAAIGTAFWPALTFYIGAKLGKVMTAVGNVDRPDGVTRPQSWVDG